MNYAMLTTRARRYREPAVPPPMPLWSQFGSDITLSGTLPFSGAVAVSGDGMRIAVSDPRATGASEQCGTVRVYARDTGGLSQVGQTIEGAAAFARIGQGLSLDGDGSTLAVGSSGGGTGGQFAVYDYSAGSWVLRGSVQQGADASRGLGETVRLSSDGSFLAAGAPGFTTTTGEAYAYQWDGSQWVQRGSAIQNSGVAYAKHFVDISDSGDTFVVGVPSFAFSPGGDNGVLKVFSWSGSAWVQQLATYGAAGDLLGVGVSLSGTGGAVATGSDSGFVAYDWNGSSFQQRPQVSFGESIVTFAASGDASSIAAALQSSAAVRSYEWNGDAWFQRLQDFATTASNLALDDAGVVLVDGTPNRVKVYTSM